MPETESDDLSFPDLGYSDESLNEVWRGIKDIYSNQDRVYNEKIFENAHKLPDTYPDDTLRKDVLPKLRKALREKNIIDIEYEDGGEEETGGAPRKVWVFNEDGDPQ